MKAKTEKLNLLAPLSFPLIHQQHKVLGLAFRAVTQDIFQTFALI